MNQQQTPNNEVEIQTPLIDILRSVPKSCREMIQDGEHSHRNIPYGRLCHEAATELAEKTNEVARLREEANTWHRHYRDRTFTAQKCKQAFIEQEKEVARLRDQIEKLTSIADRACNLLNLKGGYHESYELRDEIKKLEQK